MLKGLVALLGIYFFFLAEKMVSTVSEYRAEKAVEKVLIYKKINSLKGNSFSADQTESDTTSVQSIVESCGHRILCQGGIRND